MKILTTLTAVAALIAGMSIASAQMTPPSGSSTSSPGATGAAPGAAQQQVSGSGQFCIEAAPGGALNCKYASMAACEKDAKAQNQKCAPNPKASTTGSGSAPKQQ